jgi:RimJ/RimL family protein N-acetyltransferase
MSPAITTSRLDLIQISPAHVVAWRSGASEFQQRFGLSVADGLPDFYEGYETLLSKLTVPPDEWLLGYQIALRDECKVIGGCGYKGPPDTDNAVEIAYIIAPDYRGRGFAREAAAALLRRGFESSSIKTVRAHTLPEENASTHILTRCGLRNIGEVIDPEDGRVWRWEISKAEYLSTPRQPKL